MTTRRRNARQPQLTRLTVPSMLPNATRWSAAPNTRSTIWLINTLKGMPDVLAPLELAAARASRSGPARMAGSWVLAFIGYTISRMPDVQPWYLSCKDDPRLWAACGFTSVPGYLTVYKRFVELEQLAESFEDGAGGLMQKMRKRDPRIGAWWHIDASEAETNATPLHDCMRGEGCPTNWRARATRLDSGTEGGMRRARTDADLAAADLAEAVADAQLAAPAVADRRPVTTVPTPAEFTDAELAGADEPDVEQADAMEAAAQFAAGEPTDAEPVAAAPAVQRGIAFQGLRETPVVNRYLDEGRKGVRFFSGGHWWFTRDLDAGTRAYTRGDRTIKVWHGFLAQTIVDHFTQLPLTTRLAPATTQECTVYPATFRRARRSLGEVHPLLVGGDAGYAVASLFEFNSKHGVGSVFRHRGIVAAADEHDVHGVPRCRHCGGETDYVRFRLDRGMPRLWVHCSLPLHDGCDREQVFACRDNWRRILPVWRTHLAYQAMTQSHASFESKHQALRSNYLVAPNSFANRPKRIGMACQQLRASAATLIEWVRFVAQGFRSIDATETSGGQVRRHIARRRARLNLLGGGVVAATDTAAEITDEPVAEEA